MAIEVLRTPESRFANVPDFDFPLAYVKDLPGYEGLRGAYIDAGPQEADRVFLCLHGEPTWSFLYRRMIPTFLKTGARVIAPDLLGFGRSDKPVDDDVYNFDFHRNYLLELIEHLDLKNITLVVQDWGGILGLTLPVDRQFRTRLSRLLVMNTTIGNGTCPSDGFIGWRDYVAATPDLPCGPVIARGTRHLTDAEIAAYDAPFPDIKYKAGVRRFPQMVPIAPDMQGVDLGKKAETYWRQEWGGPSFMAVGAADPVLGGPVMDQLRQNIRGCPEPLVIEDAGHFVQEWGGHVAHAALESFGDI